MDKIVAEIQSCRYSIHDLSRVGINRTPPFATPRFNMPFELGVAVAWQKANPEKHNWFVFEAKRYRLQKSLSDLNGTDPQPTVPEMMSTFNVISRQSARIMAEAGAANLFEATVFRDLCYAAKVASENISLLK